MFTFDLSSNMINVIKLGIIGEGLENTSRKRDSIIDGQWYEILILIGYVVKVSLSEPRTGKSPLSWMDPNKALLLMKGWSYFDTNGNHKSKSNPPPVSLPFS